MGGQGIPHGEGEDNGVKGMFASVLALEQPLGWTPRIVELQLLWHLGLGWSLGTDYIDVADEAEKIGEN